MAHEARLSPPVTAAQNRVNLTCGNSGSDSAAAFDVTAGTVADAVTVPAFDDEFTPCVVFAAVFRDLKVAAPDTTRSLRFAAGVSDRASSNTTRGFAGGISCLLNLGIYLKWSETSAQPFHVRTFVRGVVDSRTQVQKVPRRRLISRNLGNFRRRDHNADLTSTMTYHDLVLG